MHWQIRARSIISATSQSFSPERVNDSAPSASGVRTDSPASTGGGLLERYHQELALRGFQSDPAQLIAVARLEELRQRLCRPPAALGARLSSWMGGLLPHHASRTPHRGLYLWGGVGRGKTWLMDLFFESLPIGARRRRHFHRFMHELHRELAELRDVETPLERIAQRLAREMRVLCFDELYVADIADAMILGGLFEGLLRHGVTLVATSNLPPAELYRDGLQRQRFLPAIALLEQHLEVLKVGGTLDYRLRQLTQAGVFLDSAASDTRARLAALYGELADHGVELCGSIEIEGRPIAVVRASECVVWFEYAALCAGPRSQNDYIEIARQYQSVIVANVPLLAATDDDEARRFIALVDEFYDRNVNLILSAAARPEQLYRGTRLGTLFARTASRLTEMQSEEYLAREHRP